MFNVWWFLHSFQVKIADRSTASRRVTRGGLIILFGCVASILVGIFLSSASLISWLQTVYILGYIKTFIGLVKYAPQALLNYRRKSTEGFAVGMIIFDLIGGAASLLQMAFLAINNDDVGSFFGNPGKFGNGAVIFLFNLMFIIQKYCLYGSCCGGRRRRRRRNRDAGDIVSGTNSFSTESYPEI